MLFINKNTKIYCSFSKNAGNKGCEFFNKEFQSRGIDAIYKSFSVNNIHHAIQSAWTLKFSGCAIAMPFKKEAYWIVNTHDISAQKSTSVNTITFDHENNVSKGYNTDYYATKFLIGAYFDTFKEIYILGKGGLAGAVKAQAEDIGFKTITITRENWNNIKDLFNSLIFNCTPAPDIKVDPSNIYIDCIIGTETGDRFNRFQAQKQFEIYTNLEYEL